MAGEVMSKVELLLEPWTGWHNDEIGPRPFPVKRMLPYIRTMNGRYVHRVRSANVHIWSRSQIRKSTHIGVRLWCGMNTSVKVSGRYGATLYPEPPPTSDVCSTCEGRAVGAGMPSSIVLTTRPIRFSPRRSG